MATPLDTHHKALSINLDSKIFGSFAEIGAGQEVARWFLRVGAASGSVAKTISAYDKNVSDDLYGGATRYVSRQRLEAMLDHEWDLLVRQLGAARGSDTRFFVFADTLSARNFAGTNESHGWMGLRFQARPGAAPHDVILHVNMRDGANLLQQQALGILGVNLIHAAFFRGDTTETFLAALFDGLAPGRIEIDLAAFLGPEFAALDPRLPLAELVRAGHAEAVTFPADGQLLPPTELLHERAVVLEPGAFEQLEPLFPQMLAAALVKLRAEVEPGAREPVSLYSLAVAPPTPDTAPLASTELLRRVEGLHATGHSVLVSRRRELYHTTAFVNRFTRAPIRFVTGLSTLVEVFHDAANDALQGALLEALARLFASNVRIYAYPMRADVLERRLRATSLAEWTDVPSGTQFVTVDRLRPPASLGYLHQYLLSTGFVLPLRLS